MADVLALSQIIWDTEAELNRLRQVIAKHPAEESLQITLASLQKREKRLQEQFEDAASVSFVDVCDYRLIPEKESAFSISSIGATLQAFQYLYSTIFDAIKNGPKARSRLGPDVVANSTFNLGYIHAGSLAFRLTVPSERLLAVESDSDIAADLLGRILQSDSHEDVRGLVDTVGVATITRAFELSKIHSNHNLSSRIKWIRGKEEVIDIVIHAQQFEKLLGIIEETSDDIEEDIDLNGRLVGLDVETNYFHMTFPDADDIKGALSDQFHHDQSRSVPGGYRAQLRKRTHLKYSTGVESVIWVLTGLD